MKLNKEIAAIFKQCPAGFNKSMEGSAMKYSTKGVEQYDFRGM